MDASQYKRFTDEKQPKSPLFKNIIKSFITGGTICTLGEALLKLYESLGYATEDASALVSVSLIVLSMLLTGFGIYPKLAKHAGAGTLVPITGFANAVASSAIEARTEGYVMGVGAKLFTIAGPVIVYGVAASFIAGLYCYIFVV